MRLTQSEISFLNDVDLRGQEEFSKVLVEEDARYQVEDQQESAKRFMNEMAKWEAQFAKENQESETKKAVTKVTYQEKSEGARYVVTVVGFKNLKKVYRIWDREEQKYVGRTFTSKRACQNEIDLKLEGANTYDICSI